MKDKLERTWNAVEELCGLWPENEVSDAWPENEVSSSDSLLPFHPLLTEARLLRKRFAPKPDDLPGTVRWQTEAEAQAVGLDAVLAELQGRWSKPTGGRFDVHASTPIDPVAFTGADALEQVLRTDLPTSAARARLISEVLRAVGLPHEERTVRRWREMLMASR